MSIQAIISPTALGGGSNSNASSENAPAPSSSGGMSTGNTGGRSAGAGGSMPSQPASNPTAGSDYPGSQQGNANAQEPITGNTQGVVGISDLKLMAAPNGSQGSVVSSDKSNVKLESGTFMLLRVAQLIYRDTQKAQP